MKEKSSPKQFHKHLDFFLIWCFQNLIHTEKKTQCMNNKKVSLNSYCNLL